MELYHASIKVFSIGDEIKSGAASSFYEEATDAMDSSRPENAPARKTALFSADSAEFALYFMLKQRICKSEINLYRVKVKDPWKTVFSITHVIHRRIEQRKNISSLVSEYWSPTKDWQFFEYLSPSFMVIDKMDHPVINTIAMKFKSLQDHDLADSIS